MENAIRTRSISLAVSALLLAGALGLAALAPEPASAAGSGLTAQSVKTTQTTAAGKLGLTSGHTYVLYSAVGSDKVLDVSGASKANGANVHTWELNRGANQQWVVKFDSKGRATFKSASSGKFLDVAGAGMKSGTNVQQYQGNGTLAQKWKVAKNKNGTFRITSALSPKLSLDVNGGSNSNGANAQVWTTNNTKAQQWRFFDVTKMRKSIAATAKKNKGSVKAGQYVIFSKTKSNMTLDVTGASTANGANVETWTYNGGRAQLFTVSYDGNGYALIKNASGKYLDVNGANAANESNVIQYAKNGGLNQRWIIARNPDGTFRIQSALWANLSLDIHGGTAANGSNVQIYPSHGNANQKWRFLTPAAASKAFPLTLNGTAKSSFNGIGMGGAKAAGIDVSVWNGNVNWNKVAASGIRFAIIRCGYGSNYASQDDSKFLANVRGARAAGLDIGVYLYSYATNTSMAKSEADHTLRLLKAAGLTPKNLKYGVYYDVEDKSQASANLTAICKKYCGTVRASGYSVGVYSFLNWWNTKLANSAFGSWNRWIAQWNKKCDYGGKYKLWQCTSNGSVSGIVGRVDMNLAY